MSNSIESPEIIFMTKIHEMTSNADHLIEQYTQTLAVFEGFPELEIPNREEAIKLAELTVNTLLELKVAVTSLTEHSAEMNDALETAIRSLKDHTKE